VTLDDLVLLVGNLSTVIEKFKMMVRNFMTMALANSVLVVSNYVWYKVT
jgi:hypothetical protein